MQRLLAGCGALALLATGTPAAVQAQERYAIGGEHVAIYNLVGEIELTGTRSGQVTIEVSRGGRDAGDIRVESGTVDGRQSLRVIYPSDRVVYSGSGRSRWSGTTQLNVRSDGTWGGEGPRGSRVRIASRGSGMDAHADLRIGVPAGQRVDLHLAVGRISAENVDGRVRLQTQSGRVEANRMAGALAIRTGSGAVRVDGARGPLAVSTGSGSVRVADARGDSVSIRTGSGGVTAESVTAPRVRLRTGSGRVRLERAVASAVHLNTGSGSIRAELLEPVDSLRIRTGSGSVTLDLARDLDATLAIGTGSGSINVDFPIQVTHQARRALRGVVGEGRGSVDINTGSGSVRLRPL